jgi:hypothetical protein
MSLIFCQCNDYEINTGGEDEHSLAHHLDVISMESSKLRPDFTVVREKMKQTLHVRSHFENTPVAVIIEKFPWLKHSKLVSVAFNGNPTFISTHSTENVKWSVRASISCVIAVNC